MPATRTQRQRRKAPTPIEIPTTPTASSATVTPTDAPETHIKRPPNCFILFRSAHHDGVKAMHASNRENELSGILSQMWTDAPESEKNIWREAAKKLAKKHKEMFPDYTFQPQRKQKQEDADQQASDENAADSVKPKAAAKKRSTRRAPRNRKAAAQVTAPTLEPTQVLAPPRASTRRTRKAWTSAAAPSAPVAGPSQLAPSSSLASRVSRLPHSDTESILSPSPSLAYDGETLQHLPFSFHRQATATLFLPAPVPGYSHPVPLSPNDPPSPDAYSSSSPAQQLPPHVLNRDVSTGSATASPVLSSGLDLRHLSREWVGKPPRFFDAAFPAHLPIAGTVGPIDLDDALFALRCAQSGISEAWVAPPPQMDVGVDISSPGFSSAPYGHHAPKGDDMLAPAMNENAVLHAMDQSAVCTFEYVLDSMSQEPIVSGEPYPNQPPSPYETEPVDYAPSPPRFTFTDPSQQCIRGETESQQLCDSFKELDELLATLVVPMGSLL